MLSLDELRADVESGAVDTVIACFTDMQGRLMGKRLDAEFFLAENEAGHGGEGRKCERHQEYQAKASASRAAFPSVELAPA